MIPGRSARAAAVATARQTCCQRIILHVLVPGGPEALKDVETERIELRDLVVGGPVGARVREDRCKV